MSSYQEIRTEILGALKSGDHQDAFGRWRGLFRWPADALDGTEVQFADAVDVFAKIAEHFAGDAFVQLVQTAADKPNDAQALYDLGYALYEESLFGIAATVLRRAHLLFPDEPQIVSELVACHEADDNSWAALDVLDSVPDLVSNDFMFAYLKAYNALMSGNVDLCLQTQPLIDQLQAEPDHQVLCDRISKFLHRADEVKPWCSLDHNDLRGWHYVITGGVLTRLSPYGFPDPMRGRYAYLQEQASGARNALQHVEQAMQYVNADWQAIFHFAERGSEIMAHAIGQTLGLPVQQWPDEGAAIPGLIAAYNLSDVQLPESIVIRNPNQLLYSYAVRWTEFGPVAPDILTILVQHLVEPWGSQMRMEPDSDESGYGDPDERPAHVIGAEIANLDWAPVELDDEGEQPPDLPLEMFSLLKGREVGQRDRFWANSPVKSSRFA